MLVSAFGRDQRRRRDTCTYCCGSAGSAMSDCSPVVCPLLRRRPRSVCGQHSKPPEPFCRHWTLSDLFAPSAT
ncbi:hypothetical protein DPMN_134180 [Dreissena polymorpha]|uniref:Uncharacterized protein n=1 Tax=Dreissena polymorpha TaxID=45954 RepID=A0A9D4FVP7_DREPO|nr:hypothetical protein DPMN_134166 [Dreissena polymorpha]KAH3805870.1 hypothetical protein DPMN_134180 [Dreissena polymorpha]